MIDQIVGLDAETFAPAHLDVWPRAIFFAQLDPEFLTSRRRERHHLVTEVDARIFADLRNHCGDAARHDLLRIRLSRIDDVIDSHAAAEVADVQCLAASGSVCSDPENMTVVVVSKDLVVEIQTELAEFPELIGDVFAGVGDGAV